jgi:hypothetical protein
MYWAYKPRKTTDFEYMVLSLIFSVVVFLTLYGIVCALNCISCLIRHSTVTNLPSLSDLLVNLSLLPLWFILTLWAFAPLLGVALGRTLRSSSAVT